MVALSGGYGKVLLWDAKTPQFPPVVIFDGEGGHDKSHHEIDLDDEENSLYAIAWSPCGGKLAVSGSNEKVLLWQVRLWAFASLNGRPYLLSCGTAQCAEPRGASSILSVLPTPIELGPCA
jgi:WD40 repeat protein